MAIMYIPKQRSPWEQMLPQILGQMALMKIQQNYRMKEHEMEMGEKINLAGGKELTSEEIKTPIRKGYRRAKFGGKVYSLPLSAEEQLQKQNIFQVGSNLYQFKNGGVTKITEKETEYQPQLFTDKEGNLKWIEPGKEVPQGYMKYSAPSKKPTSELSVIAESLGIDITKPLIPEDANKILNKATQLKKDRRDNTLLEFLLGISRGYIKIEPPVSGGLTPEEQEERERLKAKAGLQEGYNITRQPIQY